MSVQVLQSSFTNGEVGTSLWSRTDNAKYASSLRKLENYLIYPHGRVETRGGTKFGLETKYSTTKKSRIVKFEFSRVQTYFLEFGDQYIRFHKDEAIITSSTKNISGATRANPCVITATSHGFSNGDYVVIEGVVGMTRLNGRQFKIANVATHTFELQDMEGNNINASGYPDYVSGGTASKIYEIASPYLEADLPALWVQAQSFDVLNICHPNYDERTLTRTGHAAWTLNTITFGSSISAPTISVTGGVAGIKNYVLTAVAENGDESVQSNIAICGIGGEISWGAVAGASYYNLYDILAGFPAFLMKCGNGGGAGTVTTPNATADQSKGVPTNNNPFNTGNNRPSVNAYHQQRMIRANTINNPFRMWGSTIGSINNHDQHNPIEPSDAFDFTLATTKSNEIKGLISWKGNVFIFTSGEEFVMKQGSQDQSINATNISGLDQSISSIGSSYLPPRKADASILFFNGTRDKVFEIAYDLIQDGFKPSDLTKYAYHLFENKKVVDWTIRREPYTTGLFIFDDGSMASLTYMKDEQVNGMSPWTTDGSFESIDSAPAMTGEDQTCCIVKRNINGINRRYVEWFKKCIPSKAIHEAWMVDSGLSYSGTPVQHLGGLDHLEGKDVAVLADGIDIPSLKVVDGQIHLPNSASYITVGLPYNCDGETLDLEFPSNSGSVQGKPRVLHGIITRLEKTRRFKVGPTFDQLEFVDFKEQGTKEVPNYYFQGDIVTPIEPNEPNAPRLCFRATSPLPASLDALLIDTQVSGVKHAAN